MGSRFVDLFPKSGFHNKKTGEGEFVFVYLCLCIFNMNFIAQKPISLQK